MVQAVNCHFVDRAILSRVSCLVALIFGILRQSKTCGHRRGIRNTKRKRKKNEKMEENRKENYENDTMDG